MNDEAEPPADPSAPKAPTAGALLKAARERRGLHIAALAAAIKVSPRKLEALEADRLSELPDTTFVRALAQAVCRTLKTDARPILDLLPAAGAPLLVPQDAGLNAPFREGNVRKLRTGDDRPLASLAAKPLLLGALALLLASVALVLWPPTSPWRGTTEPAAPPAVALPAAPPASVSAAASGAGSAASGVGIAAPPAPEVAASTTAASGPVAETVFSAPAPGADPAMPAPAPAAMLQVRVGEASWVEVRDARGTTLLSRTVSPGEQVGLNGVPPLALVVGNAAATELVFRGRAVDLAVRSRDNVARFQLP
ncbi:MAG: helix-turn-helix domain-containing protein [Burkholderiaceae bacterium]|nr:helix-turn-helix domain-containing protein [Burkholderiaceae bacterium]